MFFYHSVGPLSRSDRISKIAWKSVDIGDDAVSSCSVFFEDFLPTTTLLRGIGLSPGHKNRIKILSYGFGRRSFKSLCFVNSTKPPAWKMSMACLSQAGKA